MATVTHAYLASYVAKMLDEHPELIQGKREIRRTCTIE
jgi:hypothetical protein